ncbi:hypothetical protein E3E26_08930 [Thermococcus sp. LS1]|nr:hypothetical protein [Thermococcus sp. LS1]
MTNNSKIKFHDDFVIYSWTNRTTGEPKGWIAYFTYWPEKFDMKPACTLGGFATYITANRSGEGYYWPSLGNATLEIHQRMCSIRRVSTELPEGPRWELPSGNVYFAIQYIPTANSTWEISVLTPTKLWTDFKDYRIFDVKPVKLSADCTCSIETVMKTFDEKLREKGFRETELWMTPKENDCFKPLSVKLYRKGDKYLYVEFAQVKGMDLVRVLMIMGNETVVKAYAEAFTAGSVEQ